MIPESRDYSVVMLIDDSATSRFAAEARIAAAGPKVVVKVFSDARSALDAVDSIRPDVIVTDLMMSVVDGRAVVRECSTYPVVVMTAKEMTHELETSLLDAGAHAVVPKGELDALVGVVNDLLTGSS